jgi:hypothetical protein
MLEMRPAILPASCDFGSAHKVPESEIKRPWWASSLLAKAAAEGLRVLSYQEERSLDEYGWPFRGQRTKRGQQFDYGEDEVRSVGEGAQVGTGLLAPEAD